MDAGSLASHTAGITYPKPVQGRVAHIDADFMAYQVSAESKEELNGDKPRKSLDDMRYNAHTAAIHIMRMAGASYYVCHTTPSGSTKGGRDQQAVQAEYQANRKGREKPEFLDEIRRFIGTELNGRPHLDQEADDGLAQAGWHEPDAIICSKDKDLRSVPGLHLDMYTGEIVRVPHGDYGTLELVRKETSAGKPGPAKLVGWGPKFFFAQCLMGDTADGVPGVPAIPSSVWADFAPSVAYEKLLRQWIDETDQKKADKLDVKLAEHKAKTKPCGPVMAYDLLKDTRTVAEGYSVVKRAWVELTSHGHEYKHWRTGKIVTPTQALLGDMQLLWMRRNKNPLDVVEWIKENKHV